MLEDSRGTHLNAKEESGGGDIHPIRVKRDLRICLVVRSNMRVTTTHHAGVTTLAWSESSAKSRNLKPVVELVEKLFLQVLAVERKHLRSEVGLYVKDGEHRPMASFVVQASGLSDERLKKTLGLMAAVPTLVMNGAASAASLACLSPTELAQVEGVVDAILMTCGGRTIPEEIEVIVDDEALGSLRSRFAASPKSGNLAPERKRIEGYVVGFSIKKGWVEFEEMSGRNHEIRAKVGSLDAVQLGNLMNSRTVVTAEVDTTTLPSGKLNNELVSLHPR